RELFEKSSLWTPSKTFKAFYGMQSVQTRTNLFQIKSVFSAGVYREKNSSSRRKCAPTGRARRCECTAA
ncbi:MAG: hypothetical protein J6S59_02395, partial [Clostridia bacterium]|nr:hypothetical protein [Clostridia bacterium]